MFQQEAKRSRVVTILTGLLLAGAPLSVEAKGNCDAKGGLFYLGNAKDDTRSIWLSATSAGSFRLDAAQGNTTVDQWVKSHRGLNITASPFVSTGNGGVHKLFDTSGNKDCLLDTRNQKGGLTLPPHISLPNLKPPNLAVPPIGNLFPGFLTPGMPGGLRPPGGVMPGVPVRPPTGVMPTVPGAVRPPIGTLPGGVMPGMPVRPPTGVMPTVPGAVRPPIGTLPPTGITPGMPVQPPTGVTPTVPGAVTPPIGTLPPTGITPGMPVQPPTGVTPTVPGAVTPPSVTPPSTAVPTIEIAPPAGTRPPQRTVRPPDDRELQCPDPRTLPPGTPIRPGCEQFKPECWPNRCQVTTERLEQVPITPGRDLGIGLQPTWNLWTDFTAINVSDGRYGLDVTGWSRSGTIGLDRRVTDNFVIGLSFTLEDNMTGGYGGFFSASSRGLTFGPYAALQLSDNWAIDAALGYSRMSNNISIAVLGGSYFSQRLSASLNLHGQYDLDGFAVRPRLSTSYIKTFSDGYGMQGAIFGQNLSVTYPSSDYDYATIEAAVELNKLFRMADGNLLMPFAEVGALLEMVRPNGGQILTSDLELVVPSPWSFSARAGVRMLIANTVLLEARAGYLSFGQAGLDVVEGRLHLSFSF